MDFVKKFAQDQLEKQFSGDQSQNQNQNQGQGQSQGYGNQQSSNFGGFNDQQGQGQGQGYGSGIPGGFGGQSQGQGQGAYGGQQGGQQFGVTGGPEYNAPHGSGGASSFMGGGIPGINQNEAIQAANQHAGNGNENASMFSQAFSFIQNMNKDDKDIDEDDVQRKHEQAYGQGNAGNMSASAMGSAAALQAIKQFTSGGSNASGGATQEKGGNDMVSKIIGMAMSEAAKMFDKSGGAASGDKQDAVTSASQTVMKLLLKNQVSGMIGGGQSGGLGQLMGMASKFM